MPEHDVKAVFHSIVESASNEMIPVYDHLEDNYVQGRRIKRGRRAPMFPQKLWNCHERVIAGLPRTTISCEAWHRKLNNLMGKPHLSFFSMLEQLNEEALVANAKIENLTAGQSPPKKKKKTDDTDKRIERIVDQYEEYKDAGEIPQFLRAIGHNVTGHF